MAIDAYDKNGHTSLMRAAIDGDLESVERLLNDGADPTLKDRDWGTSTAETYAARSAATSATHRKIRELLANATAKPSDDRDEPIEPTEPEVAEWAPSDRLPGSWPYETFRTLRGNYIQRVRTSVFIWSSLLSFSAGIYLLTQELTVGGFFILTLAPCLLLYPVIRLLFGGKDSVGAVVTTVVVEEVIKSKAIGALANREKRRR